MRLQDAVISYAARTPMALAVQGPDDQLTYRELDRLANRIARALEARGVRKNHRVAIWLEKSTFTVATMQAVLRLGAAYIPIDPLSPTARVHGLLTDYAVSALVTTAGRVTAVLTGSLASVPSLVTGGPGDACDWPALRECSDADLPDPGSGAEDLAYILSTSGSMGRPKGVCLSHRNALSFTGWAAAELAVTSEDRLANHAPLHFDLSVFDLYAAFQAGATVLLIPETWSFAPLKLNDFLIRQRPTIWYSVPSALLLMIQDGGLLDLAEPSLRAVLFAGEPFPVAPLRALRTSWPEARFLNLYGPTETNVCTFHEVKEMAAGDTTPIPIGRACSGDRVWARTESGGLAQEGEEGELMVAGPTVMLGYWGDAPQGDEPYSTGDIVRVMDDDNFQFMGRRDHMVKVRGHRVELGEIEAVLQAHPAASETVVLVSGSGLGARLNAFVVCNLEERPSLLQIKQHCATRLPRYMIVDRVWYLSALPRTGNGKVDRTALALRLNETTDQET